MRSVEFAAWLGGKLTGSARRICFIVGGPYGFSGEVYARADAMLSLSRMTFSHQLVRTSSPNSSTAPSPSCTMPLTITNEETKAANIKNKEGIFAIASCFFGDNTQNY